MQFVTDDEKHDEKRDNGHVEALRLQLRATFDEVAALFDAVRLGYAYVAMGTNQESIAEGQQLFSSGKRVEWKLR